MEIMLKDDSEITVYVVDHTYVNEFGDEQSKLCGIYTNELEAKQAIDRLKMKDGFSQYPDCFNIYRYVINRDYWQDGFITIAKAQEALGK